MSGEMRCTPVLRTESRGGTSYGQWVLNSAFQPVASPSHRRIVGYEALLRAVDSHGRPQAPTRLFEEIGTPQARAELDWLCLTEHLRTFSTAGVSEHWLFINLDPRTIEWYPDIAPRLSRILSEYSLSPESVVIELVEQPGSDAGLERTATALTELGCLIAIDDFGAGHSNFDRVWRLHPHIVKLDRSLIVRATTDIHVRRVFTGMVSLLHEAGVLVLSEGIENVDQALCALDAGVDLVQGYYFGRPEAELLQGCAHSMDLCRYAHEQHQMASLLHRRKLAPYVQTLTQSARLLESGVALHDASARLLAMPGMQRCFLLDHNGKQLQNNLETHSIEPRYAPLANTQGATWARREYFRRALAHPGEVQVSRAYLSLTGGRYCITLSIAVSVNECTLILCCDLDADLVEVVVPSRSDQDPPVDYA
jgi:EAL domain-containing protein (putative c-di-GMP-specific phosphodiesterase class I)